MLPGQGDVDMDSLYLLIGIGFFLMLALLVRVSPENT